MDEAQRREAIARLYAIIRGRKVEDVEAIHEELLGEITAQQSALGGSKRKKRMETGGHDRMDRGGTNRGK